MDMNETMAGYVDRGEIPGLVTGVVRGDEVEIGVHGSQTIGGPAMRRDTIFRIASMTKPITAAVAMMFVEDEVLELDGPVEDLIPEFVYQQVLRDSHGPLDDTVPADRPITLRDLLTFRTGFGFSMDVLFDAPVLQEAARLQVGVAPPKTTEKLTADEWIARFATLPLIFQPGTRWMYQTSATILGALLMRASGQDLESLLQDRVFGPLGMVDTSFVIPPEKLDRFATAYRFDRPSGEFVVADPASLDSKWVEPWPFPDAGGDLVGTVDDYLAFARMLGDGGGDLLSPESVALMTTQHLTGGQQTFEPDVGWGFGMSVMRSGPYEGRYSWNGGLGTLWFNDPRADLIAVLLTQRVLESPAARPVETDFTRCAYREA